ncbi:MAG: BTAD domain-containing putative transcriptional regulator [Acidimicrobiales bacterium]
MTAGELATCLEVLGPPRIRGAGSELSVPARKPNQVLMSLVASPGLEASASRLLDQIWRRDPDRSGMDSLKNAVYQANKRIGDAFGIRPIISGGGDGYAIDSGSIEIDALRFESLVEQASRVRESGDMSLLHRLSAEACGLWRGTEPLAGFQDLDAVSDYAHTLEIMLISAHKHLFEAALALGWHDQILVDAQRMAQAYPFDESIHTSLILALARSGRPRDAMETYDRLRRRLIESSGVEPSPEVQDLQMRILSRPQSLTWRPPREIRDSNGASGAPVQDPTLHPDIAGMANQPMYGRDSELDSLTSGIGDGPALQLIVAPPGMGKSRLVAEVAERQIVSGHPVLYGRCRAERQAALDPIDHIVDGLSAGKPEDHMQETAEAGQALQLTPDSDPATQLVRRVVQAVELLAAAAGDSLLLIIEDAQWVDPATLGVIDRLEQRMGRERLRVIVTCRPSALEPGQESDHLIVWLEARQAKRLDLRPLPSAAISELVSDVLPERHLNRVAAVTELVQRYTTGIPLLVNEVLDAVEYEAMKRRPFSLAHIEAVAPRTLTAAVHRRLLRLSRDAREIIKAAAVGGSKFDLDTLARVVGRSDDETAALLDECIAESLLTEPGGSIGNYQFTHELLRNAVLGEVGTNLKARLHRRFASSLDVLRGPAADYERALHLLGALPLGEAEVAIEATLRAAKQATQRYDVDEAISLLHRALSIVGRQAVADASTCDLLTALGAVQSWGGEPGAASATIEKALGTARRSEDPVRFARAVLAPGPDHRVVFASGGRLDLLMEARDRLVLEGQSPISISIEANLLGESLLPGRPTQVPIAPADLLTRAREVGEPRAILDSLFACHSAAKTDPDTAARTRLSDEIVQLGESSPEFQHQLCGGLGCRIYDLIADGRLEAARRTADRLAEIATVASMPRYQWRSMVVTSTLLRLSGGFGEADALSAKALTVGRSFDSGDAEVVFGMQLRETMRHTGSPSALIGPLRSVAATNETMIVQLLLIDALLADDNTFEAKQLWDTVRDHLMRLPLQELWLPSMALAAELSATKFDDRPVTEAIFNALEPFSGQWVPVGVPVASWGPIDGYLGALTANLDLQPESNHYFDRAISQCERAEAPTWLAWNSAVRGSLNTN